MNFITELVGLLRYINKKDILSVAHEMKWNERSCELTLKTLSCHNLHTLNTI